jgi:hypothetical protein
MGSGACSTARPTCFATPREAGAFAEAFIDFARRERAERADQDASMLFVRCEGDRERPVVDFSVYGNNRAFRLLHSSKFAVGAPLRLLHSPPLPVAEHHAAVVYLYAMASFRPEGAGVIPPRLPSPTPPLAACPGSAARCTGGPPTCPREQSNLSIGNVVNATLEIFLRAFWAAVHKRWQTGQTPFNEDAAQAEGLHAVRQHRSAEVPLCGLVPIAGGRLRLALPNLYCGGAGRPHRRQRIKLVVTIREGCFCQLCYDPDCRLYASPTFALPSVVLPAGA